MITSIIFSKNRACQLDLLLRSLRKNLSNFERVIVLYRYTDDNFKLGYDLLKSKFPDIKFYNQSDFQKNTFTLLNLSEEYVCFFVDDNIIYRKSNIGYNFVDSVFNNVPNLTCFTLRLGTNTVIQDEYNNVRTVFPQELYTVQDIVPNIIFWYWKTLRVFGDFGYPFSVDGHIYKTKDLLPLLNYDFDTPNAFEGRFDKHTFLTDTMACLEQSILVNTPLNIVGSSNNNAGKFWGHTLEELNEKYLDNNRISLNSIMSKKIHACHQEIEIEYEKV